MRYMFLLHIKNTSKSKIDQFLIIKTLIEKQKKKKKFLEKLKEKKKLKSLKLFLNKNLFFLKIQDDIIRYVINISLFKTNTILYITDIKGQLKFFCSAGMINLSGKQKTKKPEVLVELIKNLVQKAKFLALNPVALHLKGINRFYKSLPLRIFKTNFFIKIIKNYNFQPHNGCRPKKLKRKKRRKIFFK